MIKFAEKEGRNLHLAKKKEKPTPQPNPEEAKQVKPKVNLNEFIKRNYERALENSIEKKNRVSTPPADKITKDCTFKPKIDEKSKEIKKNYKQRLYELADEQQKKRMSQVEEGVNKKIEDELKLCTFKPEILKTTNMSPNLKERPKKQKPAGYSAMMKEKRKIKN